MRSLFTILAVMALSVGTAWGQVACNDPHCLTCRGTAPAAAACHCAHCQQAARYTAGSIVPAAHGQAASAATRQAPSGTVEEASRSYGVRGPALIFPAMSLRLPSLQLPGLTRFRRDPRVHLDGVAAPVASPPVVHAPPQPQLLPAIHHAPVHHASVHHAPVPHAWPHSAGSPHVPSGPGMEAQAARIRELEQRERDLLQRLERLEGFVRSIEQRDNGQRPSGSSLPVAQLPNTPTVTPRQPQPVRGPLEPSMQPEGVRNSSYLEPIRPPKSTEEVEPIRSPRRPSGVIRGLAPIRSSSRP